VIPRADQRGGRDALQAGEQALGVVEEPKVASAWVPTVAGTTGGTRSRRAAIRHSEATAAARLAGLWV
jgi:hypothetical protein